MRVATGEAEFAVSARRVIADAVLHWWSGAFGGWWHAVGAEGGTVGVVREEDWWG